MERVENEEVKEYITQFAIDKLEACDLFVEVFGKGFAKKRLDINLDKVYTNEVSEDRGGYYDLGDSSVTICDSKPRERKLSVRDIKNVISLQEVSLHELVHAILRRTRGECKKFKIVRGTGMNEDYPNGSELGRGLNEGLTNWICKMAGVNTRSYKKLTSFIEILAGEIGEKNVMELGKGNIKKRAPKLLGMKQEEAMQVIALADAICNLEYRNIKLEKYIKKINKRLERGRRSLEEWEEYEAFDKEEDEQRKREFEQELEENNGIINTNTAFFLGKVYDKYLLADVELELASGHISLELMKRMDNFEELAQKCEIDGAFKQFIEEKYNEVSRKFREQVEIQAKTYFQNGELTSQKIRELEGLASRERNFTDPEILEYIAGIINPNEKEAVAGLLCNLAAEGRLDEAGDFRVMSMQGDKERIDAYILQGETIATGQTGLYEEGERSGIEEISLEFTLEMDENYMQTIEAFSNFTDNVLSQNKNTKFEIFERLIVARDEEGEHYFIIENNQVIPATQITKEPVRPNIAEERDNLPAVRKQSMLETIRRNIRKRLYRNFNETGIHTRNSEIRQSVSQDRQNLKIK